MKSVHRLLMAGVSLAAVSLAAPALGADLPRVQHRAPAMVAPMFSWTGFYIGVHAGYGFGSDGNAHTTGLAPINIANVAAGARPGFVELDRDGFVVGGQIGYNWQTGPWVLGVEADISYTDFSDSVRVIGTTGLVNTFNQELEYLGTVRGRVGYSWGWTMAYFTGGLAYGGVRHDVHFFNGVGALAFSGTGSNGRDIETGYTVGGGIEHAFSQAWSLKLEYLYYDLGETNVTVAAVPGNPPAAGPGYNTRFENDGHIVRAGLNYKLGGWR